MDIVNDETDIKDIVNDKTDIMDIVNDETDIRDIVNDKTDIKDIVNDETDIMDIVNDKTDIMDKLNDETDEKDIVNDKTDIMDIVNDETDIKDKLNDETDEKDIFNEDEDMIIYDIINDDTERYDIANDNIDLRDLAIENTYEIDFTNCDKETGDIANGISLNNQLMNDFAFSYDENIGIDDIKDKNIEISGKANDDIDINEANDIIMVNDLENYQIQIHNMVESNCNMDITDMAYMNLDVNGIKNYQAYIDDISDLNYLSEESNYSNIKEVDNMFKDDICNFEDIYRINTKPNNAEDETLKKGQRNVQSVTNCFNIKPISSDSQLENHYANLSIGIDKPQHSRYTQGKLLTSRYTGAVTNIGHRMSLDSKEDTSEEITHDSLIKVNTEKSQMIVQNTDKGQSFSYTRLEETENLERNGPNVATSSAKDCMDDLVYVENACALFDVTQEQGGVIGSINHSSFKENDNKEDEYNSRIISKEHQIRDGTFNRDQFLHLKPQGKSDCIRNIKDGSFLSNVNAHEFWKEQKHDETSNCPLKLNIIDSECLISDYCLCEPDLIEIESLAERYCQCHPKVVEKALIGNNDCIISFVTTDGVLDGFSSVIMEESKFKTSNLQSIYHSKDTDFDISSPNPTGDESQCKADEMENEKDLHSSTYQVQPLERQAQITAKPQTEDHKSLSLVYQISDDEIYSEETLPKIKSVISNESVLITKTSGDISELRKKHISKYPATETKKECTCDPDDIKENADTFIADSTEEIDQQSNKCKHVSLCKEEIQNHLCDIKPKRSVAQLAKYFESGIICDSASPMKVTNKVSIKETVQTNNHDYDLQINEKTQCNYYSSETKQTNEFKVDGRRKSNGLSKILDDILCEDGDVQFDFERQASTFSINTMNNKKPYKRSKSTPERQSQRNTVLFEEVNVHPLTLNEHGSEEEYDIDNEIIFGPGKVIYNRCDSSQSNLTKRVKHLPTKSIKNVKESIVNSTESSITESDRTFAQHEIDSAVAQDETESTTIQDEVPESSVPPIDPESLFQGDIAKELNDVGCYSYLTMVAIVLHRLFEDEECNRDFVKQCVKRLGKHLRQEKAVIKAAHMTSKGEGVDSTKPFLESLKKEDLVDKYGKEVILFDMVALAIRKGRYDARDRSTILFVALELQVEQERIESYEDYVVKQFKEEEHQLTKEEKEQRMKEAKKQKIKRYALIGAASVGGGALLGLTGGLAAPLIVAGTGAVIGTTGAVFGSMAGIYFIGTMFGVAGAGLAGYKMKKRVGDLEEFEFESLSGDRQLHLTLAIGGWLTEEQPFPTMVWPGLANSKEQYVLRYETKYLTKVGSAMDYFTRLAIKTATKKVLKHTVLRGLMAAIAWPAALLSASKLIDNPWGVAMSRSALAGKQLADVLLARHQGHRPVSLIGFSLGARVIFCCLQEMSTKKNCEGIVQDVVLLGAPVTGSADEWSKLSKLVSGRIVNGYCRCDWILKFLYRTSSAQFVIAGLSPIEWRNRRLENIDLSEIVNGHLDYMNKIDEILEIIGIRTKPRPPTKSTDSLRQLCALSEKQSLQKIGLQTSADGDIMKTMEDVIESKEDIIEAKEDNEKSKKDIMESKEDNMISNEDVI